MAITFISQAIIGSVSEPRWKALVLVSIAELLGMSLWFGVSAVAPRLSVEWHLDASTAAWLTLAVQLGFVAGTLASALFNLPDVIRVRYLFALCAFGGAGGLHACGLAERLGIERVLVPVGLQDFSVLD